jgi:thymidylate synthase ThyX
MLPFEPHKQVINRLLEPYLYHQTLITATDWDNFFSLRDHKDAQPEFRELAKCMRKAMQESVPQQLKVNEWHIPYVSVEEQSLPLDVKLKISTARCARTSYFYHDGSKSDVAQDIQLHDRLVGGSPIHASPTEHAAQAMSTREYCKNFYGWRQYRYFVEKNIDPNQLSF